MAQRVQFSSQEKRNRVVLNVSGHRFLTDRSSLMRHPNTLLGSHMLALFFDEIKQEYFFDRDPHLFRYILNYYQSGKLHSSPDDCPVAFRDELEFFGIPLCELADCCWFNTNVDDKDKRPCHYAVRKTSLKAVQSAPGNYLTWKKRDNIVRTTKSRDKHKNSAETKAVLCDANYHHLSNSRTEKRRKSFSTKRQPYLTQLTRGRHVPLSRNLNDDCIEKSPKCTIDCKHRPWQSHTGEVCLKALNFAYGVFIILSVLTTTIETVDCEKGIKCLDIYPHLFTALDFVFVAVFTLEFLIRFSFSKNRCKFMKQIFNIIDLMAILPFYITLIVSFFVETEDISLLITLRVLRVSRIMKLSRGSTRLQSFVYTLRNCATDLLFLYFTFTLGILLFASVLYYVERTDNPDKFKSILHSLWYTCVTMMTTG